MMGTAEDRFDAFVRRDGERLRRAFMATYGPTVGRDVTQAALGYGWEHWARVGGMDNPAGYLYRVGQSEARRERRAPAFTVPTPADEPNGFEPGLIDALDGLTDHQRISVVLIHGYGYRQSEVAELLEVSTSTVRNHLRRGLDKLRNELGVDHVTT